jgi:hypothetical protein
MCSRGRIVDLWSCSLSQLVKDGMGRKTVHVEESLAEERLAPTYAPNVRRLYSLQKTHKRAH